MKQYKKIMIMLLCAVSFVQAVDLSMMYRSLGSEMHSQTNAAGITTTYWTSGSYNEYLASSGSDVWLDNGRYILFESDRPRPVGGTTIGERQLIAADTQTGTLYWLRALTREATSTYGTAHIEMPAASHYDCSPAANLVAFRDITGHRLSCLNLNNGAVSELWNIADGTFYGPPTIAEDGSWVMINALIQGPDEGGDFAGTTSAICRIAINPLTGAKVSNQVSVYDRVSLADNGLIDVMLGAAFNKFTGDTIAYDVITDNAYSQPVLKSLRFIENDKSFMSKLMTLDEGQTLSNLFWPGKSGYAYYIDGSSSLARLHVMTRRHQRWTPTLAAKKIRLRPVAKKDPVISSLKEFEISCFQVSGNETLAAYSVEDQGMYYINVTDGKTYPLQALSAGEDVRAICFDDPDGKIAFQKCYSSGSKIASIVINE